MSLATLASTLLLPLRTGGHRSATGEVWHDLLVVVTAIAVLCVSLVVLARLEPKKTAAPSWPRPGSRPPARRSIPAGGGAAEPTVLSRRPREEQLVERVRTGRD